MPLANFSKLSKKLNLNPELDVQIFRVDIVNFAKHLTAVGLIMPPTSWKSILLLGSSIHSFIHHAFLISKIS